MSKAKCAPDAEEMTFAPYDPRAICNLMLDEAEGREPITNLALQKLLYFAHGLYLVQTKRPLVSGYFEAWRHGPVHPSAYRAFKMAAGRPIDFRAEARDPLTGNPRAIAPPHDPTALGYIRRVVSTFGRMSTGRLVDVSHARGAPWQFVVDEARTKMAFGLRIPDNVILERFKYHKVTVGDGPTKGDPSEDSPFTS